MNFQDTWQQLEEIYKIDNFYKFGDCNMFYHFYVDFSDLLNSLATKTIYSSKNDYIENKAQYDHNAADGSAYVCMTTTVEGKNYMANKFSRPFGISFSAASLVNICKDSNYYVNTFNAFGEKGNYVINKGKPQLLAKTKDYGHNPFSIYSIGQLDEKTYFICGGQGVDKLWPAQMFEDRELYEELKNWFLVNMKSDTPYQRRAYYYFKDGYIGDVIRHPKGYPATYRGKPIHVSGNLNDNYEPRINSSDWGKDFEECKYDATIAFRFDGQYATSFKEVIGYGPINLYNTSGKKLLYLNYVMPTVKTGYTGPLLHGKNLTTGKFPEANEIVDGAKSKDNGDNISIQKHLFASEETFNKLCKVFNENEYRIYIRNGRDFKFKPTDIETIVLPEIFRLTKKEYLNLKLLIDNENKYNLDNPNLIDELLVDGVLFKETKSKPASSYIITLIKQLFEILHKTYNHIGIEFIPDKDVKSQATFTAYLKNENNTDTINSEKDIKVKDKSRKVINTWPDLSQAEKVKGQGKKEETTEWTTLAPIEVYPGIKEWEKARIGSEVILTAKDENNNKYVLFVYKAKSSTFMELPGGGFRGETNLTETDFTKLIKDRLSFKCNINNNDLANLTDTGKALILHEEGVALDKKVTWNWSYYRLFTAEYKKVLSSEELDYSYDNNEVAASLWTKANPVNGYNAYMRWIPVDKLTINRSITDRYSNIIQMIKSL